MGAISPSVFLTRDFLEYVLPTVVAALLLQPFTDGRPDWSLFLPVALVAGYFVSTILGIVLGTRSVLCSLEACYVKNLPGSSGVTRQQILKRAGWWSNIWDFDTLFYSLSKDDREYAYLTRAYSSLFQVTGFYFFLYLVVNVLWLLGLALIEALVVGSSLLEVLDVRTPLVGGWTAPTPLIILLTFLAFQGCYSWYLTELQSLMADWGIYCRFAARYHREIGGIATGIWGRVLRGDRPVTHLRVELIREGRFVEGTRTDENGWFQFPGEYRDSIDCPCRLRLMDGSQAQERPIGIRDKTVPEFVLDLERASWVPAGKARRVFNLAHAGAALAVWLFRQGPRGPSD